MEYSPQEMLVILQVRQKHVQVERYQLPFRSRGLTSPAPMHTIAIGRDFGSKQRVYKM